MQVESEWEIDCVSLQSNVEYRFDIYLRGE